MYHHEVKQNGCTITCYQKDMGWGFDFGMNVTFPMWLTTEFKTRHQTMMRSVAQYTANQLEMHLLTDAASFMEKQKELGFPIEDKEGVFLSYDSGKTAFIRPFIFQNKIDIHPYLDFNSVNEHGFTLTPGHYSDFLITDNAFRETLFGYTKDFSKYHFGIAAMYILAFCENLQNIIVKKEIPRDFEELSGYKYVKWSDKGREVTQKIQEKIDELCSVNQSKRIDLLVVNKQTVYDLMREYDLNYAHNVRGVDLLKVAMTLGKPVKQVEKFMKKLIEKKRAS